MSRRRPGRRARRSWRCAAALLLEQEALQAAGIRRAYPLTEIEPDPAKCIANAGPLLEQVAANIAADVL